VGTNVGGPAGGCRVRRGPASTVEKIQERGSSGVPASRLSRTGHTESYVSMSTPVLVGVQSTSRNRLGRSISRNSRLPVPSRSG